MKFNETYFIVRWKVFDEETVYEERFRSKVKAANFQVELQRKGCETWFEEKTI